MANVISQIVVSSILEYTTQHGAIEGETQRIESDFDKMVKQLPSASDKSEEN